MSNIAVASLLLKGSDVLKSNDEYSEYEWTNINLRALLGDMYDKFDTFNLALNSVSSGAPTAALGPDYGNSDIDNLNVSIYITGLPFINNTYSFKKMGNTNTAYLGVFLYPSTTTTTGYRVYNDSGILTFGKSQDQCTIRITLKRVYDDEPPETDNHLPVTNFSFSIYGVQEKSSTNGSRI